MCWRASRLWPGVPRWWCVGLPPPAGRGRFSPPPPFPPAFAPGRLAPRVGPQLTLASVLVVAGHTATFVIAARVAGSTAPLGELLALLMVVQTAMVIPLSIGGWGLREGAAAWAFAAAGLGAATGV